MRVRISPVIAMNACAYTCVSHHRAAGGDPTTAFISMPSSNHAPLMLCVAACTATTSDNRASTTARRLAQLTNGNAISSCGRTTDRSFSRASAVSLAAA